jgi:hypothetical protein
MIRSIVRLLKWIGIGSLLLFAGLLGLGALQKSLDDERNRLAKAEGYTGTADKNQAAESGYTDPEAWKRERAKRDAEIARALTEAKKRLSPEQQMVLSNFRWEAGGFGSVGIASFAIENQNDFAVKDIRLRCAFDAASGTQVSQTFPVIYDTVKSKGKRTFSNVNLGLIHSQSARALCTVAGATPL